MDASTIDADRLLAEATGLDRLTTSLAEPIAAFLRGCGSPHPPEVIGSIVRVVLTDDERELLESYVDTLLRDGEQETHARGTEARERYTEGVLGAS